MKKTLFALLSICIASSAQAQIGDFFAGASSGATVAINRHHANQILDYISKCALAVQMISISGKAKDNCAALLPDIPVPLSLNGKKFTISEGKKGESNFTITTPEITSDMVRSDIIRRNNSIISIKESGKKVKFTFKK